MQASREALLNRSEEFTDARLHRFHGATAVYDLLAITLVRYSQFNMLSEVCAPFCVFRSKSTRQIHDCTVLYMSMHL